LYRKWLNLFTNGINNKRLFAMHDIEPFFRWRDEYAAEEDSQSPFFGQTYNEFEYTNMIYNYYIHPYWDSIGSATLYLKVLYVDYFKGYALIELIGEWNDCIYNDIMYLKNELINHMTKQGVHKFVLFCDNVLNFHGSDDCYYEEWWDDIKDDEGWIVMINTFDHVSQELKRTRLQHYVNFGPQFNDVLWQRKTPELAYKEVKQLLKHRVKELW